MNKIRFVLRMMVGMVLLGTMFSSCDTEVFQPDESLLYGTWVRGTEYWTYAQDYTGKTWDVADDVTEDEAQKFTWELSGTQLTQYHQMESSSTIIPKSYKVVSLTTSTLSYEDLYGNVNTFNKL